MSFNDVLLLMVVCLFLVVGVCILDASCGDVFTIFVVDGGDFGALFYVCGINCDG